MKDLFIDTNVSIKLNERPLQDAFRKLYIWLSESNDAELVVSQKLRVEYCRSCGNNSSFALILAHLTKNGRLKQFSKNEIENFKHEYFKRVSFKSNREDQDLIPVVFLSDRKYVLTFDKYFKDDILNFSGFRNIAFVSDNPDNVPYEK